MATKSSHEFYHQFPKLAEESGFSFNTHRPHVHTDWNRIRLIDINCLIKERKFGLIEQHLTDILGCGLESEFDVKILDEGVLKIFRLAQLAVEYQQFCRHYLDRSVHVLRQELTVRNQELDMTKKNLQEKEEELKRLKKKTKHSYRTQIPYGNDNIATMILKTLANNSDLMTSTKTIDTLQYNKCSYCDKVFLNQLYLKAHISRRHGNVTEIPQRDVAVTMTDKDNTKLNVEIVELKAKLKDMEDLIKTLQYRSNTVNPDVSAFNTINIPNNDEKSVKDAEVSTNNEDFFLAKIEEWQRLENEKHNEEINLIRIQILDTINSHKAAETQKFVENELNAIEQLQATIKQQGLEITALKEALSNSRLLANNEEYERKKETEAKISLWANRTEAQDKQYKLLLQKLDEVAKDAHESRTIAETEKERAAQLQALLQQSLNNKALSDIEQTNNSKTASKHNTAKVVSDSIPPDSGLKQPSTKRLKKQTKSLTDRKSLENLHRKAQELLNVRSSSSSDVSSLSIEEIEAPAQPTLPKKHQKIQTYKDPVPERTKSTENLIKYLPKTSVKKIKELEVKKGNIINNYTKADNKINGLIYTPGSPSRLIRAKLTEEVNHRLVAVGVDPLRNTLPVADFQKQRLYLQQQNEFKSKQNQTYDKARNAILLYLNTNTSRIPKNSVKIQESPSKLTKAFSLTSVISNVKSKALSLVKPNDLNNKTKRNILNAEVAKKAMSLLTTPLSSARSSPEKQKIVKTPQTNVLSPVKNKPKTLLYNKSDEPSAPQAKPRKIKRVVASDTDEESNNSDHKYHNSSILQESTKSIETLIKSPARRPSSASANFNGGSSKKYTLDNIEPHPMPRAQSATSLLERKLPNGPSLITNAATNTDEENGESYENSKKFFVSEENILNIPNKTKSVLKNTSLTFSLNKKKVLFNMDAIQMKSVSASPSLSITDKSDTNDEKYELGLVNLEGEEWDLSSIENESPKNDLKIQVNSRTSPKIAELKHTIETQLAKRRHNPTTPLVGSIDVLSMARAPSIGGSNTSLGSSTLDELDVSDDESSNVSRAIVSPKQVTKRDDSDFDLSKYNINRIIHRKSNDSF